MQGAAITSQSLETFEAFPTDFDQHIGRAVRAFSVAERELAILTFYVGTLSNADKLLSNDIDAGKDLKKVLSEVASSQLNYVTTLSGRPAFGEYQPELDALADDLRNLFKHRALICHGLYFVARDQIIARLWSREALKLELVRKENEYVVPDQQSYSTEELQNLVNVAILCAEKLAALNTVLRQEGRHRYPSLFPEQNETGAQIK